MPTPEVLLKVYESRRLLATLTVRRATELGRRVQNEPPPYCRVERAEEDRMVLADLQELSVSRKFARIEPLEGERVMLRNESDKNPIALAGGLKLGPHEQRTFNLPIFFEIGAKVVRLETPPPALDLELPLQSLRQPTLAPGESAQPFDTTEFRDLLSGKGSSLGSKVGQADLLVWLQASMEVFQSAASSADFLPKAASAASHMLGLDATAVLLREGEKWRTETVHKRGDTGKLVENWSPSSTMLQRVLEEGRTFFHVPVGDQSQSLIGISSLVASPILDKNRNVIAVLYGEYRGGSGRARSGALGEVDVKLFELIAYGVATGLSRVDQERKLIAQKVRFEQFFTPELTGMLESRGEEMLAPRDAEITVLFCDLVGFSRISAEVGASLAVTWLQDVLSILSDCVAENQGVLVDYSGDCVEAIWGAPLISDDHAGAAVRAALQMRAAVPEMNRRWAVKIGRATDISIGINTGSAQVGNIGSRRKFKYGAFGTTVNLASRVQGATKYVGVPMILTRATVDRLAERQSARASMIDLGKTITIDVPSVTARRLCTVRTVNIDQPVEFWEPFPGEDLRLRELKVRYESALVAFEQTDFASAEESLVSLLSDFPEDHPTAKLLDRARHAARLSPGEFDHVWTLGGK